MGFKTRMTDDMRDIREDVNDISSEIESFGDKLDAIQEQLISLCADYYEAMSLETCIGVPAGTSKYNGVIPYTIETIVSSVSDIVEAVGEIANNLNNWIYQIDDRLDKLDRIEGLAVQIAQALGIEVPSDPEPEPPKEVVLTYEQNAEGSSNEG